MKKICIGIIIAIIAAFIGFYAGHASTMRNLKILYTEEGYVEIEDLFGTVNFYEYDFE